MTIKQLTFSEWIKFHKIEPILKKCPDCNGEGFTEHHCDCEFCDARNGELRCERCRGKGELDVRMKEYRDQKEIDDNKLKLYETGI